VKRNILLCVAGATPQIITETLWALMKKGERIDEVRVITTTTGRDQCIKLLLDETEGKFYRFLRDFPEAGDIKFDERKFYVLNNKATGMPSEFDWEEDRLRDILDDTDNGKAANQICEIVRQITENEDVRIHASVAGGRKTMSLYLMTAMQLFGRKDDKMSHVLVSPEVESNPFFFYKTPKPENIFVKDFQSGELKPLKKADGNQYTTDDAEIYSANIPFIRLRGIGSAMLDKSVENYAEIVRQAQENLESLSLRINLKNSLVKIGRKTVRLEPQQFFVYVLFAFLRLKNRGKEGFLQPEEIDLNDFDAVCRLISKARGEELGYRNFDLLRSDSSQKLNVAFYRQMNPKRGNDYVLATVKLTYQTLVSGIRRIIRNAKISDDYAVANLNFRRKNVEAVYGLKIEPNRIKFE